MGRKTDSAKQEYAYLLFMSGELNKTICERVGTTNKTLQGWIEANGWQEKRTGHHITRSELINKGLQTMNMILESMLKEKDTKAFSSYMDQLIKCAGSIEKLDKRNNVVNDIDAFTNFNRDLQTNLGSDKEITVDLIKIINRLQDRYITKKLASR